MPLVSTGQVFKKAGWMTATIQIIWEVGYQDAWSLITNTDVTDDGWLYAQRDWQDAAFRDLKSEGWQWHTSRIWTPAHANHLVLVMSLAYAWTLTLGSYAFDDLDLRSLVTKGTTPTYSLFRLGLRLFDALLGLPDVLPSFHHPRLFLDYPPTFSISVGG